MTAFPHLTQFRLERSEHDVAHLIFDCPGRTMNLFSEAAIEELGRVAAWLPNADVRGLVIRSGKANAFCAGADLTELGVAYDMIMAAPLHARFTLAADHFFPLSAALRALETAGKPIAAAVAGLALGGGCELAMAAHYRVLVDDTKVVLGLPESLVGLLPGGGGTQRLPRLIGIDAALPILLEGTRLAGRDALDAGLVDALCALGDEIAVAEAWVIGDPPAVQPWDRDDYTPVPPADVTVLIAPARTQILRTTLGHYPAPLAILDCVELGLPQVFDGAIRSENAIFAHLIQREEPRDMIRTMFLAKTDYERLARRSELPAAIGEVVDRARPILDAARGDKGLQLAGFFGVEGEPARARSQRGLWLDRDDAKGARAAVDRVSSAIVELAAHLPDEHKRLVDYAIVSQLGFPAYLGGPIEYAIGCR